MKQIHRILVPTDFSRASSEAFSYALWLADKVGASIDLLHIVYPGTDVMDFPSMAAQSTKVQVETAEEVMKVFTEQAMVRVQSTDDLDHVPDLRSKITVGSPLSLIVAEAKDLQSDLIVIGTQGEHSRIEVAFGTVTTAVLQQSTIPVLVIPEELSAIEIKTVGYATGLDESDPYHIWEAIQLLKEFNPILRVIHVQTKDDPEAEINLQEMESFLAGKMEALQISFHTSTREDIEKGLEDFVSVHKIDLLVMYSPKRNLFERLGHRSLSRKMALFSDVPLLVMK